MCLYTHKRLVPNEENPALWEKTDRGDVFTSAWEKKGGGEEETGVCDQGNKDVFSEPDDSLICPHQCRFRR